MRDRAQRETTVAVVNSMAERSRRFEHVNFVPAWHGTKPQYERSIVETGYAALQKTDKNFFGKGIYTTTNARYAFDVYARENGTIFLNMVVWTQGLAFPVIPSDVEKFRLLGGAAIENYQVNVVPVRPRSADHSQ